MQDPRKRRAYRPDYVQRVRRFRLGCGAHLAWVGGLTAVLLGMALEEAAPLELGVVLAAVWLFGAAVFVAQVRSDDLTVLYFEAPVEGGFFTSSLEATRWGGVLDTLARDAGVAPLSSFGFQDERDVPGITWHDAEHGLQTVRGLRSEIEHERGDVPGAVAASLVCDLIEMEARLLGAHAANVRFCLLYHDNSMSGAEVDARRGSF